MSSTLEVESTLTGRYQTTVPEIVHRSLRLGKREKADYSIRPNSEVVLSRAEAAETDDPVLGHFLDFRSLDMTNHSERLQSITTRIKVDLDAPLSADNE